jgi:hypothetical protein
MNGAYHYERRTPVGKHVDQVSTWCGASHRGKTTTEFAYVTCAACIAAKREYVRRKAAK